MEDFNKKCIITPTFSGHFCFIKKYLKSFDMYVEDKDDCVIYFVISKSEDNCSLIIKSDVSSFNFNDIDSFGITLINMLLDQIDATIDLDSNSNCSINFCTVLT